MYELQYVTRNLRFRLSQTWHIAGRGTGFGEPCYECWGHSGVDTRLSTMQKWWLWIARTLFTIGNHSGDVQGDAGGSWIHRVHSVFCSIYSVGRAKSKDFLYKSSPNHGIPDIFPMCHVFIENRIFGRLLTERLARKIIEESVFHGKWITFVRWIFPILKKYFVSSLIPTATVRWLTKI